MARFRSRLILEINLDEISRRNCVKDCGNFSCMSLYHWPAYRRQHHDSNSNAYEKALAARARKSIEDSRSLLP
jgi:hypothetical protein